MSNKKSVQIIERFRGWIKKISVKKVARVATIATLKTFLFFSAIGMLLFVAMRAPQLHDTMLRQYTSDKIFIITNYEGRGGGTGFSVTAPSGNNYIVTNSHVCEGLLSRTDHKEALFVVKNGRPIPRKIIEVSAFSDLCLLEGLPGVDGLKLSSYPEYGDHVNVIGHPHLRPLSLSSGDLVGYTDVAIPAYIMPSGDKNIDDIMKSQDEVPFKDDTCSLPKNKIATIELPPFFGGGSIKICYNITYSAYMSTAVIFPGNSGSPVFDWYGNVIGVVFASDDTNWAYIVSFSDLKFFLSNY